jgi:hypothetical protein
MTRGDGEHEILLREKAELGRGVYIGEQGIVIAIILALIPLFFTKVVGKNSLSAKR